MVQIRDYRGIDLVASAQGNTDVDLTVESPGLDINMVDERNGLIFHHFRLSFSIVFIICFIIIYCFSSFSIDQVVSRGITSPTDPWSTTSPSGTRRKREYTTLLLRQAATHAQPASPPATCLSLPKHAACLSAVHTQSASWPRSVLTH